MELTGRTRTTTCTAAAAALAGLAITSRGILRDNLPYTVGGSCLLLSAVLVGALLLIHRWISDTTDVRNALNASQRAAERDRARYIALQAALEVEQGRLNRDMAADRRRMARDLIREREAMQAEFEEKRASVIAETMEATVRMYRNGKFAPDASASGRLIQFPYQSPQGAEPQRARSREHGVVGP